jgi:hypothetical protein
MSNVSKSKVYPSFSKFQHKVKDISVNVFNPKQTGIPRTISESAKDVTESSLRDVKELSKISKTLRIPKHKQITKHDRSEAEKYQKITELKNSSRDLQSLNNFFSDMTKNISGKADTSALEFLKFLKTRPGNSLASYLINTALFNEAHKIQDVIKAFDGSDDNKFSDQKGLLESSGFIATKENQDFGEEIPYEVIKRKASADRVNHYINKSKNLVNHLSYLGLKNLAHKLIKKIDSNIDILNKKYPWINPPRLDFATLTLRNSNDYNGKATILEINSANLNLGIKKVLDRFKNDLKNFNNQEKTTKSELVEPILKKLIDETPFKKVNATSIRDFYMCASITGYQEEANQVLMKAIAAQNEDPEKTNAKNIYVLNKLFAFAVKEKLIKDPEQFIKDIQEWREGARLPEGFSKIDSTLKPSTPSIMPLETTKTDLVSALIQIQEKLGINYFKKDALPSINRAMVDHLKALREENFDSFAQLFEQIINVDDGEKYPRLVNEIFDDGSFFDDKSFPLFDSGYLLECFTDYDSEFNQELFTNHHDKQRDQTLIPGDLPPVHSNIEYFHLYNKVFKTNATDPLSAEASKEKLKTDEFINGAIDKLPLQAYSAREVANYYFTLCDEGHINGANHLLNRKIEQLNTLEENQEKFYEFADILELFGYAKSIGFIHENSLTPDNKILKTYSELLENSPEKQEKGFKKLLRIIRDEQMNPQYTIMLLNQLAGQKLLSDKQKELFTQALKRRIFLNNGETGTTEFQGKWQEEKRVNELSDLLQLSNQLLNLEIFNADDIEHLRNDYGYWNIIKKIDKEDISGIFNTAMQNELFFAIIEYNLDNGSTKNDSPLSILIDKAFESTRTLGNLDELSELLNEILKETPIFPGNVKNDLKLSLMIFKYLSRDDFFKPSNDSHSKVDKSSNSTEAAPQIESQTPDQIRINRLYRKREALYYQQKKDTAIARKIRNSDKDKPYSNYNRVLHAISEPFIYQTPALQNNKDLLMAAFYRISDNYEILKRRYGNFPANEINPEILQLALRAENILVAIKTIDKTVFADKMTPKS